MQAKQIKPLYRKVNTRTQGVHHRYGEDYKNHRNTQTAEQVKMVRGMRRGLDYTPLFMFLLSRVGKSWEATHSEAVARLDTPAPIYWMVALDKASGQDYIRLIENSYFSGLYVDEDGLLQKVAPELGPESLEPTCPCCTHSFNGKPFTKRYKKPVW